jgi:hypothetical protein
MPLMLLTWTQSAAQSTWQGTWGGFGSDQAYSVKATSDGGAVVCGSSGSFGAGGGDIYVFRVDAIGGLLWSTLLGGSGVDEGRAVLVVDEGFFIIGSSFMEGRGYDGYLARLDNNGTLLWETRYGTEEWDFLKAGALSEDNLFLVGQSYGDTNGSADGWVLKLDLSGNMIWELRTGGAQMDGANTVVALPDGGCAIGGTTRMDGPDEKAYIVRIDAFGGELWYTEFGVNDLTTEQGNAIVRSSNGDLVIAGSSISGSGISRMFLGRVNEDGGAVYARVITSEGADWGAYGLYEVNGDSLVVAGFTDEYGAGESDFSMLFVNATGDFLSGPTYGGGGTDVAYSVDRANDGNYYMVGRTDSYGPGTQAVLLIRNDGDTLNGSVNITLDPVNIEEVSMYTEAGPYPNPVASGGTLFHNGRSIISARLISVTGSLSMTAAVGQGKIHIPRIPSGCYILETTGPMGRTYRTKLMVD